MVKGYHHTKINKSLYIEVGDGHQLYVEECGNPQGIPVLFLHGGPGGSVSELSRRFFNPEIFHIILFDQRGTGRSKPFLSLNHNTVDASVSDIEMIRHYFKIPSWIVFGGSYGSTLALAYAIKFSQHVKHLVLRGIFLGRQSDIDWLFKFGASEFYPQAFARFKSLIEEGKQDNLVTAYYERMTSDDENALRLAAQSWNQWESAVIHHIPVEAEEGDNIKPSDLSIGLLEAHYFHNNMFWEDDNYILNHIASIKDLPMDIFHGRYDVDCRLSGAVELEQAVNKASLHIIEGAGHSPYEEVLFTALVDKMDELGQNILEQSV